MEKDILKQLIAIPSYVAKGVNEKNIALYIEEFLKKNCSWLQVERQIVDGDRFNLIATNSSSPEVVFVCHMDTVLPSNKNMLTPQEKSGYIYGLGACDMKAGIAALLAALTKIDRAKKIAVIFDCDEEYSFGGIKKVLNKYTFKPRLVICPEPTDMKIVNGCRGVIEVEFTIRGKTAHAGTPEKGVNAIEKAIIIVGALRQKLSVPSRELGVTTVNLSRLIGGREKDGEIITQANTVADIAQVLLDIRPSKDVIDAKYIFSLIERFASKDSVKVTNKKINLDYPAYLTPKKDVFIEGVGYRDNLGAGGFYEAALISRAWSCPCISFGPGDGSSAHTPYERVNVRELQKTKELFIELMTNV